ncbi:MAG: hypothetical protein EXR48_03770 [Dehalococcoidia bacterium]|nr:hypothetical protein [Dehalococcoidia bacterium]
MPGKKEDNRRISQEQAALEDLLLALVRAHADSLRPNIPQEGIEERDLAFEAGLLAPPDMETNIYATRKRNRIVYLLRKMQERGWARMETVPPRGAYHLFLLPQGVEHAHVVARPWWKRLLDRRRTRLTG